MWLNSPTVRLATGFALISAVFSLHTIAIGQEPQAPGEPKPATAKDATPKPTAEVQLEAVKPGAPPNAKTEVKTPAKDATPKPTAEVQLEAVKPGAPPNAKTEVKTPAKTQPVANGTKVKLSTLGDDKTPQSPPAKPGATNSAAAKVADRPSQEPTATTSPLDVRPASFQEVTPGVTTTKELKSALGAPKQEIEGAGSTTAVYAIGPFPKVEFEIRKDVVQSASIQLADARPAKELQAELSLVSFRPVIMRDADGKLVSQHFPERGISLEFDGEEQVRKIHLKQIQPSTFVTRARQDKKHLYSHGLVDLAYAIEAEPKSPDAYFVKASLLQESGRHQEALDAIEQAILRKSEEPEFQILHASVLVSLERFDEALAELNSVLENKQLAVLLRAQAELALGDWFVARSRDYQQAFQHHQKSISLAAALSKDAKQRSQAQSVLRDAHYAVANDLAWGNWSRKAEVVPRWLGIAETLNKQIIAESGDSFLTLLGYRQMLSAYAGLKGELDPTSVIEAATELGKKLIAETEDPIHKQELEWTLGECLFHGARIEQKRKHTREALVLAQNGTALIEQSLVGRQSAPHQTYLNGRLQFLGGSLQSVGLQDHKAAVRWFERAYPLLSHRTVANNHPGAVGDRLVSMGVSYWQTGKRELAVKLTQSGAKLIERAIENGRRDRGALEIAFGNLSSMYRTLGKKEMADSFEKKAAALEARRVPAPIRNRPR